MARDSLNKAAPGLFPQLIHDAEDDIRCIRQGKPAFDSDQESVESILFRKVFTSLPRDFEAEMASDKFYLVKRYKDAEGSEPSEALFEDFQGYDNLLRKETELRQRLELLTHVMSNKGMVLPFLENWESQQVCSSSGSPSVAKHKTNSGARIGRFMRRMREVMVRKNENISTNPNQANMSLSSGDIDGSFSTNVTEIIDERVPEVGFIDSKRVSDSGHHRTVHYEHDPLDGKKHGISVSVKAKKDTVQAPTIQRKLKVRHLQMISLGATIGVGLLLNSGKAFSIAGPLGTFLGFLFGASIVLATVLSFAEIVALIPLITGISGLCSRFVSDAFGFSVGWCHWTSYAVGFPSELTASAMMLASIRDLSSISYNNSHFAITITVFVICITLINLLDVRYYGECEYVLSSFKLLVVAFLIVLMIVMNVGTFNTDYIGFRYWDSSKSPAPDITYGPFRPTFDLDDSGTGALNGIGGFGGVVLSCIASTLISVFSYVGIELGFIAASEAQNPRKAVPLVTKRIFSRIIIFYLLSIFVMGLNVYSGDPRLLRYSAQATSKAAKNLTQFSNIISKLGGLNCESSSSNESEFFSGSSNQAPWIIALKSCHQCTLSSVVQSFFVAVGLSSASSQLYASSRTLYAMATQGKAPAIFTICSKRGVPYVSVLASSCFGFLALLSISGSTAEVFIYLVNIGTTGGVIVWFGMNLSFCRLYYALRRRTDIISRSAKEYPYKSPLQPYLSIYGMVSTVFVILMNGFQNIFNWNAKNFISSYLTALLFTILYLGYTWIRGSKINKLDQIDLDSGRREMDLIKWKEEVDYTLNIKEFISKIFSYL